MSATNTELRRKLWSKSDAAHLLSVSERVVDRLVRDGELDSVLLGRRRLIPDAAIDEYVTRLRRSS